MTTISKDNDPPIEARGENVIFRQGVGWAPKGQEPQHGSFRWLLADGTEALRLDADGKVYVGGKMERTDKVLVNAFSEWLLQAGARYDKNEPGTECFVGPRLKLPLGIWAVDHEHQGLILCDDEADARKTKAELPPGECRVVHLHETFPFEHPEKPDGVREIDYWDCEDSEQLTHTDQDDAIEYVLDSWLTPKMTPEQVLEALPKKIKVTGYARMKVEVNKHRFVDDALEMIIESLDEEYGGEDETTITVGMRKAANAFVEAILAEYCPYQCEPVVTETIDVEKWVRDNNPHWLEP